MRYVQHHQSTADAFKAVLEDNKPPGRAVVTPTTTSHAAETIVESVITDSTSISQKQPKMGVKMMFRMLIVFDEASILADTFLDAVADQKTPLLSGFRVLRRVFKPLKETLGRYSALPIFMDTASNIATFASPSSNNPSHRFQHESDKAEPILDVFPPFSTIGSRPDDFVLAESGGIGPELPSSTASSFKAESAPPAAALSPSNPFMRAMLRGRPLWRATFDAQHAHDTLSLSECSQLSQMLIFAIEKLQGGVSALTLGTKPELMYDVAATVGSCLLNLVIEPGSPLSHRLVRAHMVRCIVMYLYLPDLMRLFSVCHMN